MFVWGFGLVTVVSQLSLEAFASFLVSPNRRGPSVEPPREGCGRRTEQGQVGQDPDRTDRIDQRLTNTLHDGVYERHGDVPRTVQYGMRSLERSHVWLPSRGLYCTLTPPPKSPARRSNPGRPPERRCGRSETDGRSSSARARRPACFLLFVACSHIMSSGLDRLYGVELHKALPPPDWFASALELPPAWMMLARWQPPPNIMLNMQPFPWQPNLLPMPPEYRYYIDAPDRPSPLSLLDSWARTESYILSPALRVTHSDAYPAGSGFAIVTRRPMKQGDALLRVPARLTLTADSAVRAMPWLLSAEQSAHVSIAMWLMRLVEAEPASLRPYLRSLRTDAEVDCVLRWTDEEIAELEPWTVAYRRAARLRQWAHRQWQALFTGRPASQRPAFNVSRPDFDWAMCAVLSRSFSLPCADAKSCGATAGASGADAGSWRVFAPVADLLNHAPGPKANAVLIQPEEGFRPEEWRQGHGQGSLPSLEEEAVAAAAAAVSAGPAGDSSSSEALSARTDRASVDGSNMSGTTAFAAETAGRRPRSRQRARQARARARSLRAQPRRRRSDEAGDDKRGANDAPSAAATAPAFSSSDEPRHVFQHHPHDWSSSPSPPSDDGALSEGLSDYGLGGGGGVWLWRERGAGGGEGGLAFRSAGSSVGMNVAGSNWMQRVCYHALCIPEPDTEGEAWDAVTAVSADASERALVVRALRNLEAGEEVFLDYGPRSNAELLTTHGFALPRDPHGTIPLALEPTATDETAPMKRKILAAGNLHAPFLLSPELLRVDSDVLVALRIIAATPTELQRYKDAFRGQPLSARNEIKWRKLLKTSLLPMLEEAEQVTTVEQDRRLLQTSRSSRTSWQGPTYTRTNSTARPLPRAVTGSRSDRRRRAAILCRMGEKQLIRDVISDIDAALLEQKAQPETGVPQVASSSFKVKAATATGS